MARRKRSCASGIRAGLPPPRSRMSVLLVAALPMSSISVRIPEPEDRKHELIVVTSTLDKYSGKVDSPVKEELKDHELKKSEDKLQLHLVKKDGVFTIEKKSRNQVGRRKKRKTALNFKTDNCNICKFCNVSIIIFFKLIV